MFNRLFEKISKGAAPIEEEAGELHLAAAFVLVACMSADYKFKPEETRAVADGLFTLFGFDRHKSNKLIARAVAAREIEPSIFGSAMIIARFGSEAFKKQFREIVADVAGADGELHDYEKDLLERLSLILNRSTDAKLQSAA
jgi:uncharacterized tellurite resistance protein B-like protein